MLTKFGRALVVNFSVTVKYLTVLVLLPILCRMKFMVPFVRIAAIALLSLTATTLCFARTSQVTTATPVCSGPVSAPDLTYCHVLPGTLASSQQAPRDDGAAQSADAPANPGARQPAPQTAEQQPDKEHQKKQQEEAEENEPQQTKRMLWVAPNFAAVGAGVQFTPLTTHEKFVIAFHDSFDYSAFTWTAIEAFQGYELNSDPEFGRGRAAYGRYYWHNYVDGLSGTYFTEAIVPALTHEDPRYFTLGRGGVLRRTFYSLTRTLITKTDSGGNSFNWSEVGGNALEAALSNAYYPAQERTVGQTFQNWGVQMESATLNNVAKEFWPDIRRKVFRRK